jgi:hypothetical protein
MIGHLYSLTATVNVLTELISSRNATLYRKISQLNVTDHNGTCLSYTHFVCKEQFLRNFVRFCFSACRDGGVQPLPLLHGAIKALWVEYTSQHSYYFSLSGVAVSLLFMLTNRNYSCIITDNLLFIYSSFSPHSA